MRSKCSSKSDRENTEAILRFSQDGTPIKNTGSHLLKSDGENATSYCTTGSPWRRTSTRLRKLKEFRLRIIGFSLQIFKEKLGFFSINDLTLLKRTGNANDCTMSTWQEPKKKTEPFFAVTKKDSEKGNNWKVTKNLTTPLTRTQVGDSTDSRGETCGHLSQARGPTCKLLRHRRQRGIKPSGERAIRILSIFQVLTSGDFFCSLGQVSFAWRNSTSQPPGSVNSTPTNTARTELHKA